LVVGSISHPKLYPPHTKRPPVLRALPLFVPVEVEKAHIAHPVEETAMDTAARKRKVHQENSGRNSLVWVGVLLGSSSFFLNFLSGRSGARKSFFYLHFYHAMTIRKKKICMLYSCPSRLIFLRFGSCQDVFVHAQQSSLFPRNLVHSTKSIDDISQICCFGSDPGTTTCQVKELERHKTTCAQLELKCGPTFSDYTYWTH